MLLFSISIFSYFLLWQYFSVSSNNNSHASLLMTILGHFFFVCKFCQNKPLMVVLMKVNMMSEEINLSATFFTQTTGMTAPLWATSVVDIFKGSVIHQRAINSTDGAPWRPAGDVTLTRGEELHIISLYFLLSDGCKNSIQTSGNTHTHEQKTLQKSKQICYFIKNIYFFCIRTAIIQKKPSL